MLHYLIINIIAVVELTLHLLAALLHLQRIVPQPLFDVFDRFSEHESIFLSFFSQLLILNQASCKRTKFLDGDHLLAALLMVHGLADLTESGLLLAFF